MICANCNRNLTLCICEGEMSAENRIAQLRKSPFLAMDWDGILAERFLNKFQIEADRKSLANTPNNGQV